MADDGNALGAGGPQMAGGQQAPENGGPAGPSGDPQAQGAGPGPGGLLQGLQGEFDHASAAFSKVNEVSQLLGKLRGHLDTLVKMGDMVTQADLSNAASGAVSAGMGASQVAAIISDAPAEEGAALAGYVSKVDEMLRQEEDQVQAMLQMAGSNLALNSLHMLAAHSMGLGPEVSGESPGEAPQPTAPGNSLLQ